MTDGLHARVVVGRGESFRVDLSLDIPDGTTVALLGPNGAGKSTVVAAIAGLLRLDSGRIELSGSVLDDPGEGRFVPAEERNIGVVFQDQALFPHLSITENIAFGLRSRGLARQAGRERAREWIDRLDLGGLGQRRPGDLSGGQAQRVALARALVIEPDLLLLDEPLSAIDVGARSSMRRVLREHLGEFGGPRLLITHDPTEAFLLADEIVVIEDGAMTQGGTADEIRLRPRTTYAASVAGANLVAGTAAGGVVHSGDHRLHIADHALSGQVLAIIRPTSVSVHRREPEGSPRNTWKTTVEHVEGLGDVVRLMTGAPLPLTVEITEAAAASLQLVAGSAVWVSIKATEITVESDQ